MRLQAERPIEMADGPRHLIHNYGHGGAGMTLAFGSAELAADLADPIIAREQAEGRTARVAILGAGVIGLTTARAIRRRHPATAITIFARECEPAETTSHKAGGMFAPISNLGEYHEASQRALLAKVLAGSSRMLVAMSRDRGYAGLGLSRRPTYSIDETGRGAVRVHLGKGTRAVKRYDSWLIDPTLVLPGLKRELQEKGVSFIVRHFADEKEVYQLAQSIIVNCTGLGAKALFGDELVEARRGHLVLLPNPKKLRYLITSWCGAGTRYLFARENDIVIGGSTLRDDLVPEFDPMNPADVRAGERILRSARSLFEPGAIACA